MKKSTLIIITLSIVLFLAGLGLIWSKYSDQTSVPKLLTAYSKITNIDQINFEEPSGLTFHSHAQTLFVVGDEGHIAELTLDGQFIKGYYYEDLDFEGITVNPQTGLLYVIVEDQRTILEISPATLKVQREFFIPRYFRGQLVMDDEADSLEGITFVPNVKHPHGGTFFVTNQSFDLSDETNWSGIFEVEVPLRASAQFDQLDSQVIGFFTLNLTDLSGIHYDSASKTLFVISDSNDKLVQTTIEGKKLKQIDLVGQDQEGITFDYQGNMYLAQDSGGILKVQ